MAGYTSNAAYAYDMQPDSTRRDAAWEPVEQAPAGRVGLDVVTGAGRASNQQTSPAFLHCIKVFCALVAVLLVVGIARVSLATVTAGVLNANATLVNELEDAQDESADLEVMYSVYGSSTRIRSLAESYGMVESEDSVTLDFTEYAEATSASEAASAADAQ